MKQYLRYEHFLQIIGHADSVIVKLTSSEGTLPWEATLESRIVDAAAVGMDEGLRQALSPILPIFSSTSVDGDGKIARVTISITEKRWASIAWEAFAPAGAVIVRVCPVRPRVAQIPLAFPMRILESGGTPKVADVLRMVFNDSDRSLALIDAFAENGAFESFPEIKQWPTVEILHLREVEPGPGLVRCLQQFSDRFQTRLVIIEADKAKLPALRQDAQSLIERAGPALWLADSGFNAWVGLYAGLAHDRPLDWLQGDIRNGELFAGAGREELLRYSGVGETLSRPAIKAIAKAIETDKQPDFSPPELDIGGKPFSEILLESLNESAKELDLSDDESGIQLGNRTSNLRLASAISTKLINRGLVTDGLERALQGREWSKLKPERFVARISLKTEAINGLSSLQTQTLVSSRLKHLAKAVPMLDVESHESDGMLPIATKMAEVRALLGAVRGQNNRSPRPPRHVNAAFFSESADGGLTKLAQAQTRLVPGQIVHLGIQIGAKDKFTVTLGSTALIEEVFRSPTGCWIEIGLTAIDFDLVGDPVQRVWLPADAGTDLVTFAVSPRPDSTVFGIARLRFSIFHENNIVQSFLMATVLTNANGDVAPYAPT